MEQPMKPPLTQTLSPRRGEGFWVQRYNKLNYLKLQWHRV